MMQIIDLINRNKNYLMVLKIIMVHFIIISVLLLNKNIVVFNTENEKFKRQLSEEQVKQLHIENSNKYLDKALSSHNEKKYKESFLYLKESLKQNLNPKNITEYIKEYNFILNLRDCEIITSLNLSTKDLINLIKINDDLINYSNFIQDDTFISSIKNTFDFYILSGKEIGSDKDIEFLLNNTNWVDKNNNKIVFKSNNNDLKGKVEYFKEKKQYGYYSIKKTDIFISFGGKNYSGKFR